MKGIELQECALRVIPGSRVGPRPRRPQSICSLPGLRGAGWEAVRGPRRKPGRGRRRRRGVHVRDSVRTVPGAAPSTVCARFVYVSGWRACACVLWGAPWVPRAACAPCTSGFVFVCGRTRSLEIDTSPVYLEVGAHGCPLEQMRNKDPSEGSGPVGGHARSGIFFPSLPSTLCHPPPSHQPGLPGPSCLRSFPWLEPCDISCLFLARRGCLQP